MVEVTVLGISLQGEENAPVLLLHPHGTERILSLGIGPMEAFAVSSALNDPALGEKMPRKESPLFGGGALAEADRAAWPSAVYSAARAGVFPRPMTHDLLLNMVQALGGRLLGVEILRVVDGVFLAEAVISGADGIVRVDCRPSDGVALALRCKALLRAADAVLAYAEDMQDVLQALPEHVRLAVNARSQIARKAREGAGVTAVAEERPLSPSVAAALRLLGGKRLRPSEAAKTSKARVRRTVIEVPASGKKAGEARGNNSPAALGVGGRPSIRISMMRRSKDGELEFLEEFQVPSAGVSVTGSENLERLPGDAAGMDEEARWAALLHVLSPETKVLM